MFKKIKLATVALFSVGMMAGQAGAATLDPLAINSLVANSVYGAVGFTGDGKTADFNVVNNAGGPLTTMVSIANGGLVAGDITAAWFVQQTGNQIGVAGQLVQETPTITIAAGTFGALAFTIPTGVDRQFLEILGPAGDNFLLTMTTGDVSVSATPLPAALPMFASALAGVGLFRWVRKRKQKIAA